MKLAKDFLSRFQSLTPPDEAVRSAVAKTIHAIAGVPLTKKEVTLANGIAFIDCSSVAKSAIKVHRGQILEDLFNALPKAREVVRDIR